MISFFQKDINIPEMGAKHILGMTIKWFSLMVLKQGMDRVTKGKRIRWGGWTGVYGKIKLSGTTAPQSLKVISSENCCWRAVIQFPQRILYQSRLSTGNEKHTRCFKKKRIWYNKLSITNHRRVNGWISLWTSGSGIQTNEGLAHQGSYHLGSCHWSHDFKNIQRLIWKSGCEIRKITVAVPNSPSHSGI